jgi:uncharacterized protein YfiM (DUF2279 family)
MKTFVITIIIIFGFCYAQSTEADSVNTNHRIISFDKVQHAAVSCLLTLSSQYIMVNKSGFSEQKALSYSVSSSALFGLAKEFNDCKTKERSFDWSDLIADGVGLAIAAFIIIQ